MQTASVNTGSSQFSDFTPRSTSWQSGFQGQRQNSFAADIAHLVSAIQSGNATNAQEYLTKVEKLVPSSATSSSPLGKFLSSVTSALSNNNITGAQTALNTFENRGVPTPAAGTGTGTTGATAPSTNSGGATTNALGQDVLSLFTAIGSGDLQGAQSAYDTVISALLGGSSSQSSAPASTSSPASTTSAVSAATPSGSSSNGASFVSLLSQIGSALSTGDIDSAQTAVDGFLQKLTAGSLVGVTA